MTSNEGFSVVAPMRMLRLVEAVDLVDEDDGPESGLAPFLALAHHVADLLYAARDRREVDELGLRHPRDDPGKRGLAGPRRSPENTATKPIGRDRTAQERAFRNDMLLPDKFVQRVCTHALRERFRRFFVVVKIKQIHLL